MVAGVGALVVALVVAMGGSAVVLASAGVDSAEQVLARAQRFAERQTTATFTRRSRIEVREEKVPGGFFADTTGEGVAAFRQDAYRLLERAGPARGETLLVDGTRYVRVSAAGAFDDELYAIAPDPDEAAARAGVLGGSFGDGFAPTPGEPHRLVDLIAAAGDARSLADDDGLDVVRARVALRELADSDGIRRAVVVVHVAPSGRLDRVVVEVEADGVYVEHDYVLTAWSEPVDIVEPDDDDIDRTPEVDDEAIARVGFRVLQPRGIPEGWMLESAIVLAAEDTGTDCEQVEIAYIDPDDPDRGFLTLYEMAASCGGREPRGAAAFRTGSAIGWVVEALDAEDTTTGLVVAGTTAIEFETDLALDELAIVLADLAPFDTDIPPQPIGGIGTRRAGA